MTTALKLRRGTTTQHSTFTGADGEVTVDTTKKTVVVHDGATAGGTPLMKETGTADSKFRITSAGNVGIGTSSPSVNLDVVSSTVGSFSVDGGSASGQGSLIRIRKGGADRGYIGIQGAVLNNTSDNLMIWSEGTGVATTFFTNGAERMRIDTNGNVGVGTSSPSGKFDVYTGGNTDAYIRGAGAVRLFLSASSYDWKIASNYYATGGLQFVNTGSIIGGFDQSGNFAFNSGYGSAATAYGCRAWVNFNGTGTVAIRASGNVSSITDNGAGDYSINFSTAMPDVNYSTTYSRGWSTTGDDWIGDSIEATGSADKTTGKTRIKFLNYSGSALTDAQTVNVAIHR